MNQPETPAKIAVNNTKTICRQFLDSPNWVSEIYCGK